MKKILINYKGILELDSPEHEDIKVDDFLYLSVIDTQEMSYVPLGNAIVNFPVISGQKSICIHKLESDSDEVISLMLRHIERYAKDNGYQYIFAKANESNTDFYIQNQYSDAAIGLMRKGLTNEQKMVEMD